MNVLIIGSGGREHAIAYKLKQSKHVDKIFAIPGNPGIARIGTCIPGNVEDLDFILNFVNNNEINYTIIGPEVPLCLGLADLLENNNHKVFGPKKIGANLEGSKAFSKDFMYRHNIPTAKYVEVSNYQDALNSLNNFTYPLVIKADGLAAGKGVVICNDKNEADNTLKAMMIEKNLKDAGNKVIIEEFLTGFECSLLCFTDSETIIPMVSAKDHKQVFDGNLGPNTGGMGTVSPNPFMPENIDYILKKDILIPFINGLKKDNIDFRGVIFIGLMINNNKAKVLEFNVRFGDPETQSILLRLESDLFEIMNAVTEKKLNTINIKWSNKHAGCLVLASDGYPSNYKKGLLINNINKLDKDIVLFHAGTMSKDGNLYTNGGRVLNICATGNSLLEVRKKLYKAAEVIDFDGKFYRKDIGLI